MTDKQENARQQRLRAALRENLKRRKGQIRGRASADLPAATAQEADEGIGSGKTGVQESGGDRPKAPEER